MCAICVDLIRGQLTTQAAKKNLNEMAGSLDEDHIEEVEELIEEIEDGELDE